MSAKKELSENTAQARWESCRRMVVKVGSTLLVDQASGKLRREWIESLADDIADMQSRGREILIVSSGAVALGRVPLEGFDPAAPLPPEEGQP